VNDQDLDLGLEQQNADGSYEVAARPTDIVGLAGPPGFAAVGGGDLDGRLGERRGMEKANDEEQECPSRKFIHAFFPFENVFPFIA
jgi:hypothetical protein